MLGVQEMTTGHSLPESVHSMNAYLGYFSSYYRTLLYSCQECSSKQPRITYWYLLTYMQTLCYDFTHQGS